MKSFRVYLCYTVYTSDEVEAESKDEALEAIRAKVADGQYNLSDFDTSAGDVSVEDAEEEL